MQRFVSPILAVAILAATASAALAQADAQKAYNQAKDAYQAGDFGKARDLAEKASKTDVTNPEVFLLLGKAHYQLGELDEAIAAWKRTLALAPEEPFAKRMLEVLQGKLTDVDTRIQLIKAMIREKLYSPALQQCVKLLAEKALSDAQRARVMTLQAELYVRTGKHADTHRIVQEVLTLYPQQADLAQTTLLLGQAKLYRGGESTTEGLDLLKKVVADHPDTPAAVTARLELISFDLRQAADTARADALAQWLADSPQHPMVADALKALMEAYLTVSAQGPNPTPESELSPLDAKALALAAELYKQNLHQAPDGLTERLLAHLKSRYVDHGAHAAAAQGAKTLLAAELPRDGRLLVLKALAGYRTSIATRQLDAEARAGKLPQGVPRGKLPPVLADVTAVYDTIDKEFPANATWADRAALAATVRGYAPKVLPQAEFTGLKGPDAWALDIAMPVIGADADAAAVKSAVETVQGIIHDRTQVPKPGSRKLAVELSTELAGALSPTHGSWSGAIKVHAELLDNYAKYLFDENVKAGNSQDNAKLSDVQKQLLATLQKHVTREAGHAPAALEQLTKHLQPWIAHGHWAVAEEAYTTLAEALPETERRQADLAVVHLWIRQVMCEHQRLAAAGLTVPRELDPTLAKVLLRCYELQAGLEREEEKLAHVRGVWDSIVNHYKRLEYFDVAEAAIRAKADQPVEAADEYAAFQLVRLKDEHPRRELARLLKQYGGSEKIVLGPEFQEAIAGWKAFITDRPDSPLVAQAIQAIFEIARLFERHRAHLVAAEVYGDIAKFAAGINVFSQAAPGTASTVEQAAFSRVNALDVHARKILAKQMADRKSDEPPPAKLSEEFAAAIAACKGFVEAHPECPLVGDATTKVMAVGYEYAKIDAWDVADSVYADLLGSKLDIRRPERLKFARGLCQLGRAIPDHARKVLQALTTAGIRGPGVPTGGEMLAWIHADGSFTFDVGGDRSAGGVDLVTLPERAGEPDAMIEKIADLAARPAPQPSVTAPVQPGAEADRDTHLLAMIRRQESQRALQVAQLRENLTFNQPRAQQDEQQSREGQQAAQQVPATPVLSDAELTRQENAISAAYDIFQGIRKDHPHTPTAEQARGEILVMVGHWRGLSQWQRSAALAQRFLDDNQTDQQRPKLSLEVARDWLAWASKPLQRKAAKQEMLKIVSERFDTARKKLAAIVTEFPKERSYQQQAQWDIAKSFLTQARVIGAFSPTLARGQYVRTSKELGQVARKYPDHPQIGTIPQMLWNISAELEGRGFDEEAILVWNELSVHDPMHSLSQQAALKIAQTYHQKLKRPLKAAQAYQELNFARGGSDQSLQNAIFQIGSELKVQKRYVEALHVLETFVDSFPRHAQAGQALTMVGQIHQTNEAWKDAIAAYRRVIDEFANGQFRQDAKWAIAECTINLSQWREAMDAYREYVKAYPKDAKAAEANRRIEVLKDLARYQGLVDEEGQRKAFDAQHQIATIVRTQLSNPVKAIIEFRKVAANWPQSRLADDALYAVGTAYLSLGETEKAREALLEVAQKYPASILADDALYMLGKSFEDEATKLATVTRDKTLARNKEVAQRRAYQMAQSYRYKQQEGRAKRIAILKQAGKGQSAEFEEASLAGNYGQFNDANVRLFAQKAIQEVETLTAIQLADRQDKINAGLRKAVEAYTKASKVAGADKADEALLQMATIYDQRLKDSEAAMATWLEIDRQFRGTSVAEDASWRVAQTYERQGKYAEAIEAYNTFLRNYRGGTRAGQAQFAIAENYEHLGQWVKAMDSYTNYITNFPDGPLATKAKGQITWIKTYREL